jgi:hypothetical protein
MKRWLPLAILALAPLAAPLLAASHPLIALVIRSFFSRLCHQDPARSFVVQGSPVAVCVRCLGIYCGVALGALFRSAKMPGAVSQLLWLHKGREESFSLGENHIGGRGSPGFPAHGSHRGQSCAAFFTESRVQFDGTTRLHRKSGFDLHQLRNRRLLEGALLLNLLDVAAGMLHWYGNLPLPRFFLGLILGMGAGAVLFSTSNPKSARYLASRRGCS